MDSSQRATVEDLLRFIESSPSPYHACEESARRLSTTGFQRLVEEDPWTLVAGNYFVMRGGSIVAFSLVEGSPPSTGFRMLAAHTDSPNLRIKPRPDRVRAGCRQLGVEVYGGVLLGSWLDRDLGLSGRVFLRAEGAPRTRLVRVDRPILRVAQLAIHLNREVNSEGLRLNPQEHLLPIFGTTDDETDLHAWLAHELGESVDDILSYDLMCHDTLAPALVGRNEEFVSAARLDNLASCHAALLALLETVAAGGTHACIPVISFFDHEEVGSTSQRGAQGPLLRHVLERTVIGRGGSREDYHRALSASLCVSADMAHATHPNYIEKHDPEHSLCMNAGPVIKINANQRYASEGETQAIFQDACERAQVPYQKWVNRSDLGCGSTIGPITAANLGVRTVDVGNAQLAMHSIRELSGAHDPSYLVRALSALLSGPALSFA